MKKRKLLTLTALLMGTGFVLSSPVMAQNNIDDLKAQINTLSEKVIKLEKAIEENNKVPTNEQRWSPFDEINRMERQMNSMFQNSYSHQNLGSGTFNGNVLYSEGMNIEEKDKKYIVTFDISGFDKNNINIEVKNHSLTVSGKTSQENDESGNQEHFKAQSFGAFSKTVSLPKNANAEGMKTEVTNGKLVITFPKKISTNKLKRR